MPAQNRVRAIHIIEYGIMEYSDGRLESDPMSSIGADITRARMVKITASTDQIPLRAGVSYGIRFVLDGPPVSEAIPITVILRSSLPCVLRETGAVVYENKTVLNVRIGIPRYVGGRIVIGKENPCIGPLAPTIETFEIYYEGRKYAERRFSIVDVADAVRR